MATELATNGAADSQIRVVFKTRQQKYVVTDTPLNLPTNLRRFHLSEIINHLLGNTEKPVPFDFVIDGKILKTSIQKYIDEHSISTENILEIEYIESIPPPAPTATHQHEDWISCIHGQRSHSLVCVGSYDGLARLWNVSGECVATLKHHTAPIKSVAWAPSGSNGEEELQCFTADENGSIAGWKYTVGAKTATVQYEFVGHQGSVNCISVNSTGTHLASGSWDESIKIWDVSSGNSMDVDENDDDDDDHLRKGNKKRRINKPSISRKKPLVTLEGHTGAVSTLKYSTHSSTKSESENGGLMSSISHDKMVFSGGWDHTVRCWDVEAIRNVSTLSCEKVVLAIDQSPHSGLLATGHTDDAVRLWDPRSQDGLVVKLALRSHKNWVSAIRWAPATNPYMLASASYDGSIKIWDIRSSNPLHTIVPPSPASEKEEGSNKPRVRKLLALDWVGDFIVSGGEEGTLRFHQCKV
ncbi:WD repeat-containing protein 12 [Quaeritorhiza haematococci]|nr:WD repeat-containing protein 12 [Quaeritorhiza haematococci]